MVVSGFKAVVLAALVVSLSSPVLAFNVNPMIIEIKASPGKSHLGSFEVANGSEKAAPLLIYKEDWDMLPNGEDVTSEPGTVDRSCTKWGTLNPTQIVVPPKSIMKIKYHFAVPNEASGSYWTIIYVEGMATPSKPTEDPDKTQMAITTKMRYGIRLFINIESDREVQGSISGVKVELPSPKSKFNDFSLLTKVAFDNTGNVYVKPRGIVEIRNLDGETVQILDLLPRYYVMPGRMRWLALPLESVLPPGEYLALAILDYGSDNLVAGETHFVYPIPDDGNGRASEGDSTNSE